MLQTGGPCAGFGTCVNSTLNPSRVLCRCDPGRSGASDFFDSRVEQLPDGSFLALTCAESTIGTYVMWGTVAALGLVRTKQLIPVFWYFYQKYRTDRRNRIKHDFWGDFALKMATWDLFVVTTIYWIFVIAVLAGGTLGTNILATVMLPIVVVVFNFSNYWMTEREFSIFIRGTVSPKQAKAAESFRRRLKIMTLAIHLFISGVPTLWSLSTDKSKGPVDNYEYLTIVLRNSSTILWGVLEAVTSAMVRKQIMKTIQLGSSEQGGSGSSTKDGVNSSSPTSSKVDRKVEIDAKTQAVLTKMETELRSLTRFLLFTALLYSTFLVPYLYPYQTYNIAFAIGTGSLRHCGKSFHVQSASASKGESSHKSGIVAVDKVETTNPQSGVRENTVVAVSSPPE